MHGMFGVRIKSEGHYWHVINHRNFTPRLIEQTILQFGPGGTADDLLGVMQHALDHPLELWGPSFRQALTETARTVLLHLVSFPTHGAPAKALRGAAVRGATPIEYQRALRQLEGSWITIQAGDSGTGSTVSFHNPSCRDFILSFIDSETEYLVDILLHATDTLQISQVIKYAESLAQPSEPKYPGILAIVKERSSEIAELVRSTWSVDSENAKKASVDVLYDLSKASDKYGFGLFDWILDQVLSLSERLEYSSSIDGAAAYALADALMCSDRTISTAIEQQSCKYLYWAWCSAVTEYSEWDSIFGFRDWLGDIPWTRQDEELVEEYFESWLSAEFDAILENAEYARQARDWAEDSFGVAEKHFGGAFDWKFESFEESVVAKYEDHDYEPSREDYESERAR